MTCSQVKARPCRGVFDAENSGSPSVIHRSIFAVRFRNMRLAIIKILKEVFGPGDKLVPHPEATCARWKFAAHTSDTALEIDLHAPRRVRTGLARALSFLVYALFWNTVFLKKIRHIRGAQLGKRLKA